MLDVFGRILEALDRSYVYVSNVSKLDRRSLWLAVAGLSAIIGLWLLWRRWRRSRGGVGSVVKYLLSSSARHIDSAVSLRGSKPLEAYEHAVYGAVMATAAKDLVDDKASLSKEVGVDVYAYLDYANKVLTQIKQAAMGNGNV
jgi:hypothetical protein